MKATAATVLLLTASAVSASRDLYEIRGGPKPTILKSFFSNTVDKQQKVATIRLTKRQSTSLLEETNDPNPGCIKNGGLSLTIIKGTNLSDQDFFSKSDGYVKYSTVVGTKATVVGSTDVVGNTHHPEWNKHLCLGSGETINEIKFQIFDKDVMSQDDDMGTAVLTSSHFGKDINYFIKENDDCDESGLCKLDIDTEKKDDQLIIQIYNGPAPVQAAESEESTKDDKINESAEDSVESIDNEVENPSTKKTKDSEETTNEVVETTNKNEKDDEKEETGKTSTSDGTSTVDGPSSDGSTEDTALTSEEAKIIKEVEAKKCTEPFCWACDYRIRKDFRDLTKEERALYWDAINDMKRTPTKRSKDGSTKNLYDEFVIIHAWKINKPQAHGTSMFLPWHRKFLLEFETALRQQVNKEKYSCLTIPYWDWSQNAEICANDPECKTWHHDDPVLQESGGPGDPQRRVKGMRSTHGSSIDATHSNRMVGCMSAESPFADWLDHNGNCLSRGVSWDFATNKNDRKGPLVAYSQLMDIIHHNKNYGTYNGFRQALEGTPHNTQHNMLGGHMRSLESPADPIFFMHHCQVDRIWAMWQDCHDHDALDRTPTSKDMPNYGASGRYSFKVGLNEELLFVHPIEGSDLKAIIPDWNTEHTTPKPFHSSTHMDIPVIYAPDEMMKIMKSKQRKQVCNYDTHESKLIEIGHGHILERVHKNTVVGDKLVSACTSISDNIESNIKNGKKIGHVLMEAANLQCQQENKKSQVEGKNPPLNIAFMKRWINQDGGEEDTSEMETVDKEGAKKMISSNRFKNVYEHRPELLLPRCALFEGSSMKDKRDKMRAAIDQAMIDEEENDRNSNEDLQGEEEKDDEANKKLRGKSEDPLDDKVEAENQF
jgi:tyrosinase